MIINKEILGGFLPHRSSVSAFGNAMDNADKFTHDEGYVVVHRDGEIEKDGNADNAKPLFPALTSEGERHFYPSLIKVKRRLNNGQDFLPRLLPFERDVKNTDKKDFVLEKRK